MRAIYLKIHIHVSMIGDGRMAFGGMRKQENKYACEIYLLIHSEGML